MFTTVRLQPISTLNLVMSLLKAVVLPLVFPVAWGVASAQGYRPLLAPNSTWQDEYGWASLGPNTSSYECIRFYIESDSLVDELRYSVLKRTGHTASGNGSSWFSGAYVGLLREDTADRRVYFRPPNWNTDQLFYDFGADVGPYPWTYRFASIGPLQVDSIDTVLLADGPHRRWNFEEYGALIEGIGYEYGFKGSNNWGEIQWLAKLVCHTVDGDTTFSRSSLNCPCGINVGIPTISQEELTVIPSPTTGDCRLNGAEALAYYQIITPDGLVVHKGRCSTDGTASLDLTPFPSGLYIILVESSLGARKTRIAKI